MALRRPRLSYLAPLLACLANPIEASKHIRFHNWFPNSEHLEATSVGECNATLTAFEDAYDNIANPWWVDLGIWPKRPIFQLCRDHASCILTNTSEADKASLATSGVVLGLLPTLLAVLSPSIAELALLSAQRPFLACMLSVGAPGVLQTRVFEYEDPAELIDAEESARRTGRTQLVLGPWSKGMSVLVSVLEYLLAAASIVNTIHMAVELERRGILSWGCTRNWPTIVWACIPLVIHGIAAIGYKLTLEKSSPYSISNAIVMRQAPTFFTRLDAADKGATATTTEHDPHNIPIQQRNHQWIHREWLSCASHSYASWIRLPSVDPSTRVTIGVMLNCIAGFLSFFHLLYGTVVFSGLLFIDPLDAIGQIAMRFLTSSMICRFIVLVEIAGMRGAMLVAQKSQ